MQPSALSLSPACLTPEHQANPGLLPRHMLGPGLDLHGMPLGLRLPHPDGPATVLSSLSMWAPDSPCTSFSTTVQSAVCSSQPPSLGPDTRPTGQASCGPMSLGRAGSGRPNAAHCASPAVTVWGPVPPNAPGLGVLTHSICGLGEGGEPAHPGSQFPLLSFGTLNT